MRGGAESGRALTPEDLKRLDVEAFWDKTRRVGRCLVWCGVRLKSGYGQVYIPGRRVPTIAHRVAYVLTRGWIPASLCVCHTCDNPPCIEPLHLFLANHNENMADMVRKGRAHKSGRAFCGRGHPKLPTENCVLCHRLSASRRRARRREAKLAVLRASLSPRLPTTLREFERLVGSERDAVCLARNLGLYGLEAVSLSAMAAEWGLSRERLRQITDRALRKIGAVGFRRRKGMTVPS